MHRNESHGHAGWILLVRPLSVQAAIVLVGNWAAWMLMKIRPGSRVDRTGVIGLLTANECSSFLFFLFVFFSLSAVPFFSESDHPCPLSALGAFVIASLRRRRPSPAASWANDMQSSRRFSQVEFASSSSSFGFAGARRMVDGLCCRNVAENHRDIND